MRFSATVEPAGNATGSRFWQRLSTPSGPAAGRRWPRTDGTSAAIEEPQAWVVNCSVQPGAAWATRTARITARTARDPCWSQTMPHAGWSMVTRPLTSTGAWTPPVWLDTVPGLSGMSAADVALI